MIRSRHTRIRCVYGFGRLLVITNNKKKADIYCVASCVWQKEDLSCSWRKDTCAGALSNHCITCSTLYKKCFLQKQITIWYCVAHISGTYFKNMLPLSMKQNWIYNNKRIKKPQATIFLIDSRRQKSRSYYGWNILNKIRIDSMSSTDHPLACARYNRLMWFCSLLICPDF